MCLHIKDEGIVYILIVSIRIINELIRNSNRRGKALNENERNLGYLLNKAARITKWELNNKLSDLGLTSSQFAVLRDLYTHRDSENIHQDLTPAFIALRLHADRPTISGIVERLVKQGWVERVTNPEDRRSQLILLTDKAMELLPTMEAISNDTMEKAMHGLKEEEVEALKTYLTKIINNFS